MGRFKPRYDDCLGVKLSVAFSTGFFLFARELLTYSIFELYYKQIARLSRDEGAKMPRERFKTLTEQMFYILLCLYQERRGADILEMVRAITADRVSIGSGTLYDLLEQFAHEGMIQETKAEGRRRSYIITEKGRRMLEKEYLRLQAQTADYNRILGKDH